MHPIQLPSEDIEHILNHTEHLWRALDGKRLFITGGTGFFGIWLLETFRYAQARLKLDLQATVLSRSPRNFLARFPHFKECRNIHWLEGDISNFHFPAETHSHIIHAATEVYARDTPTQPIAAFDAIIQGTRRVLNFAQHTNAEQVLLTSSGAIYGQPPAETRFIAETYRGSLNCTDMASLYGEGKRTAEMLATLFHSQLGLPIKIARCFTFVGPHLPLNGHHAIGNFIDDVCHHRPIVIQGDGTPVRSYLHMADLIIWLLTILLRGVAGYPYNVGSDHALSIAELANLIASLSPTETTVRITRAPLADMPANCYVPDISRAHHNLGLTVHIPLEEAIRRTLSWHIRNLSTQGET